MFSWNNHKYFTYTSPFTTNGLHESPNLQNTTVVYIANPLSPSCWKHRSIIPKIQHYCSLKNIHFSIFMGYWQPDTFKQSTFIASFVKNDTEPACRAVAAARIMLLQNDHNDHTLLQFFTSIQEKFFERGEDATHVTFYKSICEAHHLDYAAFVDIFNIISTVVEFKTIQKLGNANVPSLMVDHYGTLYPLATEALSLQEITAEIDGFLGKKIH